MNYLLTLCPLKKLVGSLLYMCVIYTHHICTRIFFLKVLFICDSTSLLRCSYHFSFVIMSTRKHVPFLNLSWFLLVHISYTEQRVSFELFKNVHPHSLACGENPEKIGDRPQVGEVPLLTGLQLYELLQAQLIRWSHLN